MLQMMGLKENQKLIKAYKINMSDIVLIQPPGWTLHPGGPHIALPLLKGFFQNKGISTKVYDLNVDVTNHYQVFISEDDVIAACKTLDPKEMNKVYFGAEDRLQKIAAQYDGTWFPHEGYRRNHCNLMSPQDIFDFSQLDSPFTNYFKNTLIPDILKQDPCLIGISITVPTQMLQVFELVRLLRKAGYSGFIALGGNIVTRLYKDLALPSVFDLVDGLVHLQGERTLFDIYSNLKNNKDLSLVPNLTWCNEGVITRNLSMTLKPSEFSAPDFSDSPQMYWGTPYLTMVAGRGCYYVKCSFCSIPFGYGEKGYIGASPAEKVVGWMQDCSKAYNISRFKFIDEALHPKIMDHKKSAKAGLKKVYLGLELIPSDGRDLLTKLDHADPLRLLSELKEAGIKTHVFCMFGFPGTGVKDAFRTVEFALKHHDLIDTLDIFPFYYARHTSVEGVIIKDDPKHTWNVEHVYEPNSPSTLHPSKVSILAEQLGNLVWKEQPQWFHPVYRMYSPWHN
jgi:hypothetical protein